MIADDAPHVAPVEACQIIAWRRVEDFEVADVLDTSTGLIARQTWTLAAMTAKRLGGALPTREQTYRHRERADHVLEPIALPDAELARREGVSYGDGAALQALRTRRMGSVAWSRYHDAKQAEQLAALPSGGTGLVFFMKPWIDVPGALAGWYTEHLERFTSRRGAGYVQQGFTAPHNPEHHDYATPTRIVRPFVPSWFDRLVEEVDAVFRRAPALLKGPTLGERALAWALAFEGLAETPGVRHTPEILAWGALCRRGGVYLGKVDGRDRWSGSAVPVGAATDEEAWCAKFASASLAGALRDDEAPPHGLRVSVAELCSDARALGTLHLPGHGYVPRVGDLAIFPRSGGNPLSGGPGHVARVISLDPLVTLGGNESPGPGQVHRTPRRATDVAAWIGYG